MTTGRRDSNAPGYNPPREHFPDRGQLTGEARVLVLLGKTSTAFETQDQFEERIAREDFAQRTVLPAETDKRGEPEI